MPETRNSYSPPMPEPRNSYSPPEPEPEFEPEPEPEPEPELEPEPEPDIQIKIQTLHETLTHAPPDTIENSLTAVGIRPSHDIIYSVLLLSYATPDAAVKFFRWAGRALQPLQEAWNLIVHILGKNEMFEEMWEAVRAMRREGVVGLSTFGVIFECYCRVKRFDEAIMSFEVMGKYGVEECVEGVNLLLGWMCEESGGVEKGDEFYERVKSRVLPDGDTFRVLLEGCEREGNAERAMSMFGEMVVRVGWSKENVAAYDAFLGTLVGTSRGDEAIEFLEVIRKHECLPSSKFFVFAVESLVRENDAKNCIVLWDIMVEGGMVPNLVMYNEMIGLLCRNCDDENAIRLLDQMVFHGAFPDTFTYNVIFECLLKKNKVCNVGKFFYEMVKNECPPSNSNCSSAIAMLFEGDDPDAAVEIWDYLVENNVRPLDECGNELLIGLCKLGRFADLSRFAGDMLDMEINIYESTMSTLKNVFLTYGRGEDFESLSRRWEDS